MTHLATPRLVLEPLSADDVQATRAHWIDPGVRRWLWDDKLVTEERVATEIAKSRINFEHRGFGIWGARRHGSGALIGCCGLLEIVETGEVEILFSFAPETRNRGLATEASLEVLEWGFGQAGLERIVGGCDAPNTASQRVLAKIGMRLVEREPIHGVDLLHYEIERGKFEEARGRQNVAGYHRAHGDDR